MDFDRILDKWENRRGSGKTSVSKPEVDGGKNWLDRYPPGSEILAVKEKDRRPPVSEGRSVWVRRRPQDSLDLHGLNSQEAQAEMKQFIRSMRRQGLRKGLIIHGKGLHSADKSVLVPLVRNFLETSTEVGEFGRAAQKDGGSGATWFVLRQRSR